MKKKLLLAILFLILLTGCGKQKVSLETKYYKNNNGFMETNANEIKNLENKKETFALFVYNNYCNLQIPCEDIFSEFLNKNQISFYKITFEEFKTTDLYETILYAPSVIIISKSKIIAYLDANKDEDVDEFTIWFKTYVKI